MHTWPVQDAKARFSELLETCSSEGPQVVTKHGKAAAVLVPIRQWDALQATGKPSLKEALLSATRLTTITVPARGSLKLRRV